MFLKLAYNTLFVLKWTGGWRLFDAFIHTQ